MNMLYPLKMLCPFLPVLINFETAYKHTRINEKPQLPAGLPIIYQFQAEQSFRTNKFLTNLSNTITENNIRAGLIITPNGSKQLFGARGTNYFRQGDAVITYPKNFEDEDVDNLQWVLTHEISHIKNNDLFTVPVKCGALSLAAAIVGILKTTPTKATILALTINFVSIIIFGRMAEVRADDFANKFCTDKQLQRGIIYLKAQSAAYQSKRLDFFSKIIYSENGENRIDIIHPSLSSRIKKIEKILIERKCNTDINQDEIDRVAKLLK